MTKAVSGKSSKRSSGIHDHRQLRQLISGIRDGVILVDLDQTILWANEPALAMHGASSLSELGVDIDGYRRRFRLTYRNKHVLKAGDIPIADVLAGKRPQDVTVEVSLAGDPEACRIHRIRCLVVTNEDDEPDYLVVIVEDETDRYQAVDRFESAFNANPAPAVICRIDDLTYVRANRGFLEMTGYDKADIVGRTVKHIDLLAHAANRDETLKKLQDGRTVSQMELDLPMPDGGLRHVLMAGQPIDIGDEPCLLFTFADLDARQRAETALRQSEERFSKAFALSPAAMTISRTDTRQFIEVNQAFAQLTGFTTDEAVGRSATDIKLWVGKHDEDRMRAALAEHGTLRAMDLKVLLKDGGEIDCLLSAEAVTIGDDACILCVIQDITERKRTEAELVAAIETVMSETSWFSRKIVEKLAGLRQTSQTANGAMDVDALSERERDVLGFICEGASDKDMAEALGLSPHTVRNHVSSLYRKLGVAKRGAAVVWARERGIVGRAAIRGIRPKKSR